MKIKKNKKKKKKKKELVLWRNKLILINNTLI